MTMTIMQQIRFIQVSRNEDMCGKVNPKNPVC
jgi:hypothetical protein